MTGDGPLPLTLVAAVAQNGVIGADGRMPWHLPGDLAHFRALTMGHALVMGRTTFESIGRPLPGRSTTVLSRDPGFAPEGVAVASDLASAIASATRHSVTLGAGAIMVVGGATVYAATIEHARTLVVTEVEMRPDGDAVFPPIDAREWRRGAVRDAPRMPGDEAAYRFVRWDRIGSQARHPGE